MVEKELELSHENRSSLDVIGIALCGGLGERMAEVTGGRIPKPLIRVKGAPLIDYSIRPLYASGVRRFVFCVSRLADRVINHVSEIQSSELTELTASFSHEEAPLGIAQSIRQALNIFDITGDVVIFDTDAIRLGLDFHDAYRFHKASEATTTLVCGRVPRLKDSHFAVFDDKNGEVALIVLRPEGASLRDSLIKCGMIICSPSATRFIRGSYDFPNSWAGLVEYLSSFGGMRSYVIPNLLVYSNINTPEELREAERLLVPYQ